MHGVSITWTSGMWATMMNVNFQSLVYLFCSKAVLVILSVFASSRSCPLICGSLAASNNFWNRNLWQNVKMVLCCCCFPFSFGTKINKNYLNFLKNDCIFFFSWLIKTTFIILPLYQNRKPLTEISVHLRDSPSTKPWIWKSLPWTWCEMSSKTCFLTKIKIWWGFSEELKMA